MGDIVNHFTKPSMSEEVSSRRVQRVRHEIKRRELQVLRVQRLSPHVRSVTLGGESLADFISPSFDDHLKLFIDVGAEEPARRDYTPRSFDNAARELTLEFALHGDGPAAGWAEQAAPGQRVTVAGPRGSFLIPLDYDWHLLAGDETALPAIARRLEELPAGACAIVLLHHTSRGANRQRNFAPATLEDLAYSGVSEFSRQWLLLSRRSEYVPGTGRHELWFSVGGSAGHSGQ